MFILIGRIYYSASAFDPELGRFTQADTIVPEPANPQSLNRYSYCDGNPINYTDPTGHFKLKDWIGDIVGAVAGVITFAMTGSFTLAMTAYSFISGTIDSYNAGYSVGQSIGIGISSGTAAYLGGKIGGAFGSWVGGGNASASALGSAIFGSAAAAAAGAATHSALTGGNVAEDTGIGAAIGGTMGLFMHGLTYQPTTTTSTTTSGSSDPVAKTAADGDLQGAGDAAKSKYGPAEGGMKGAEAIVLEAQSPKSPGGELTTPGIDYKPNYNFSGEAKPSFKIGTSLSVDNNYIVPRSFPYRGGHRTPFSLFIDVVRNVTYGAIDMATDIYTSYYGYHKIAPKEYMDIIRDVSKSHSK